MIISKKALDARKNNPNRRLPYHGIRVRLRFDLPRESPAYGFQPDALCMPVYCGSCRKTLSDLYCHCGSYFGYVGDVTCDHCGHVIGVTDRDNIVDSIRFDGVEYRFDELYKLSWRYLSQLERNRGIDIRALFADTSGQLRLEEAAARLERAAGVEVTGAWSYVTNPHFTRLPEEVNRWIELLELCGVSGIFLDKGAAEPKAPPPKKLPGYPPFY